MASNRTSNINMVLCFVLGVIIALSVKQCTSKPAAPIEKKGSFKAVTSKEVEVRDIPIISQNSSTEPKYRTYIDSTGVIKFRERYELTKTQYDSLLVVNKTLDSMANASNDKRYQQMYTDCKFVEFNHTFKDCTMTGTVSGISRGAPDRLKFDYKLKLPKPKEMVFQLRAGLEAGATKTLSKFNTKANLGFMLRGGKEFTLSADMDQRFYLGYSTSIFTIEK